MRPIMRLWNQKGPDSGAFLFGRMAASYGVAVRPYGGLLQ